MNYVSMSVYLGACLCVSASGCVCVCVWRREKGGGLWRSQGIEGSAEGGQRRASRKEERREGADRSGAYCNVDWMNQSV